VYPHDVPATSDARRGSRYRPTGSPDLVATRQRPHGARPHLQSKRGGSRCVAARTAHERWVARCCLTSRWSGRAGPAAQRRSVSQKGMSMPRPYRLNVAGDFYVEDGCCTLCGVPEAVAPDLFESGAEVEQCYVKRQPASPDELRRMVEVFARQDLGCIRYRGRDRTILKELADLGERERCDVPLPRSLASRLRGWLGRRGAGT
jgi:hypothetical protein